MTPFPSFKLEFKEERWMFSVSGHFIFSKPVELHSDTR